MVNPVVYEVNLYVDAAAADAVAAWLPGHIEEMLAFDGFGRAQWYDLGPDEAGRARWSIHYHVADRAHLDHYFDRHAAAMRADGLARFPGAFTADRRILAHRTTFDAERDPAPRPGGET